MITLISPAKTLDFDSEAPIAQSSDPLFAEKAEYLVKKLQKLSVKKLKTMMSISENLAQLNVDRFQKWSFSGNDAATKQAIYAFMGDVYVGLKAEKFSKTDLDYAQSHLRILSGLYGVLRPCDLMQPYRLEMGTSWQITPTKKGLYQYWKKDVTRQIYNDLSASNSSVVLNLASQEYSRAVDFKKLGTDLIAPEFREERGDKFQMISFFAKKARGMMAAFVLQNRITSINDLKNFNTEGYTYNERLSAKGKNNWVFTRKSTQTKYENDN